jgi:hypothetical protein
MGLLSHRAGRRALACLAVCGVGGIAGLLAGFSGDPVQPSELSPAEVVALRFPGGMNRIAPTPVSTSSPTADAPASTQASATQASAAQASATQASAGYVLASAAEADSQAYGLMFSPFPTYASPAQSAPSQSQLSPSRSPSSPSPSSTARSSPAPSPAAYASLPPQLATASVQMPAEVLAYAAPDAADDPAETAAPVAHPEGANAPPTSVKRAVQPPHPVSSGPASTSNAVLNNAQIASIRERLKLTSYQTQLWPPVESALRDITWQGRGDASHKTAANPRGAAIDPNSVPVQRLKSAAFPLIMSLSDDQKQEVRTMVRLMGLENLASQF